MTAPAKPRSDTDEHIRRLQDAVYELRAAADRADEAVSALDQPPQQPQPPTLNALVCAVLRLHEDTHTGPIRWCPHEGRVASEMEAADL